jgi:ssDNA-binding Zn-finger/Zn-ribbon topoisomerase 1
MPRQRDLFGADESEAPVVATGERCFECGGPMVRRSGRFGLFWVCQNRDCGATFADRDGRARDSRRPRRHQRPTGRRGMTAGKPSGTR